MNDGGSTKHDNQLRPSVKLVHSRTGKRHISVDGFTTVCGVAVAPDRVMEVKETAFWPDQVNCYNCAYRHTPAGYLKPLSGSDFPLRKVCPNHPSGGQAAGSCDICDPSSVKPHNWPCPNGCTEPLDHNPRHRMTRCTVYPPRRESGPDGRCVGGCESTERAMKRANPKLWFDLADSAMTRCYHCGEAVCLVCQRAPVDSDLMFCDQCG